MKNFVAIKDFNLYFYILISVTTRGGPTASGLGEELTARHRKNQLLVKCT
jgi:hypothetical protein